MSSREKLLAITRLGWRRMHQDEGVKFSFPLLLERITGCQSLEECEDVELFALVRAMRVYGAFEDLKTFPALSEKVIQIQTVTAQALLGMTDEQVRWLMYNFDYMSEQKGLQYIADSGLFDAWLRILRLWEGAQTQACDEFATDERRSGGQGGGR